MILTPDQQLAHDRLVAYAANPTMPHIALGGFAGTGKTTVTAQIVRSLRARGINNLAFCCFTGKAASVLRSKLVAAGVLGNAPCTTIHSLIYETQIDKQGRFTHSLLPALPYDLIIVDEASMVNEDIWKGLTSFKKPIIAVGDHGQLPPIARPGTESFSLMKEPHIRLEQIHRQAENSPIIRASMMARKNANADFPRMGYFGGGYDVGIFYMKNDRVLEKARSFGRLRETLYLCAINRHRVQLNKALRDALGYKGDRPMPGEKIICLKNNHDAHVYNGVTGVVLECRDANAYCYFMRAKMDDGVDYAGMVLRDQFNEEETIRKHPDLEIFQMKDIDLFDFGYALTVHKSQGSEADHVALFMFRSQKCDDEQWRRWLYTGITRAKKTLLIVNRLYNPKPEVTATN